MVNLNHIKELRKNKQHEEAKSKLIELAAQFPNDPVVQYETACVHDFLGLEAKAIPFYLAAIHDGLSGDSLRNAYLGLGSTYRALGMYKESKQIFVEGLQRFPDAAEIRVFLAMTQYNLSENHEAVASLLKIITSTTSDLEIKSYTRAIEEYAEDLNRIWE